MKSSLASRLEDIPGVASVVIDLEGFGRGIDVRLEPDADEAVVMEKLRALLAAYGLRRDHHPVIEAGRPARPTASIGVDVKITPVGSGARVEVATASVKSFRIVSAEPLSIAQGLADTWCQVIGRVPLAIVDLTIDEDGTLVVVASDGERETRGVADINHGWLDGLTDAVARALGEAGVPGERTVTG